MSKKNRVITLGAIFTSFIIIGVLLWTLSDSLKDSNSEALQDSASEVKIPEKKTEQIKVSEGIKMTSSELQNLLDDFSEEEENKILAGGPPPDGIPSIDNPQFVEVSKANSWLQKNEPIIFVQIEDEVKAYPMQVMMWHEIINDTLNEMPITVTYCPLCNTSFSFLREVDNQLLDFGTTGYLYGGALMMYDRQTHSLWSHFGGEGLAGPLADQQLQVIPSSIISWDQFKEEYPNGKVLSKDTGFKRSYGRNPYVGYDDVNEPPFLFSGTIDNTFAPKERIIAIEHAGATKAYLLEDLKDQFVIHDEISSNPIVLFYREGTASGLEHTTVAGGRDVGSTNVFFNKIKDEKNQSSKPFTFFIVDEKIKDQETGSTWNFFGEAIDGPLEGERLEPVPFKVDTFWFAWANYAPDTQIFEK